MGLAEVEFELKLPASDDDLRRNVAHALTLGLPDLRELSPRTDALTILANGPSALDAPFDNRPALALNGALRLYKGLICPAWWAACDPQALVAEFVTNAPEAMTYFVASKCHPDVFDALKGRHVILWHLDEGAYFDLVEDRDPVMVAPSITICAFELGERLGFRRFETWGWDGCYMGGRNHATPQDHDASNIDLEIGEATFRTSTTWACEAQNAVRRFEQAPRDVVIHGGGMMDAMLRFQGLLPRAA